MFSATLCEEVYVYWVDQKFTPLPVPLYRAQDHTLFNYSAERSPITPASTGVSTSAGENSLDGSFSVHNAFGWAERLDLNMEYGEQKSTLVQLAATRPRFMGTNAQLMAEFEADFAKVSARPEYACDGDPAERVALPFRTDATPQGAENGAGTESLVLSLPRAHLPLVRGKVPEV